jgi:hypothetical protein
VAHAAALKLQRLVRGHYARAYAALLRTVMCAAAVRVQACYRGMLVSE